MANRDGLSNRIDAEFAEARRRIEELQQRAAHEAESIADRYEKFEKLRQRITDEIMGPRVESLVEHFDNVEQAPHRDRFGTDVVLSFGLTSECPANIHLTLSLTHDERIERVVLTYDLKILPVFIKFEPHTTFDFALEEFDSSRVANWLDDQLVAFVKTCLSLQFVDQYQRDNLVSDPVAKIRFPKSFAKATGQYAGHTYYFLSDASKVEFDKDPTLFVTSST